MTMTIKACWIISSATAEPRLHQRVQVFYCSYIGSSSSFSRYFLTASHCLSPRVFDYVN